MIVHFSSNFRELAARAQAAAAQTVPIISQGVEQAGNQSGRILWNAVRVRTPVRSGELESSTTLIPLFGGLTYVGKIDQPALSKPNPYSGRGGGFPYVLSVVGGRVGFGPKTAKVLWGLGFGPSMHSGPGPANDYPAAAAAAASGPIFSEITSVGEQIAARLAALI